MSWQRGGGGERQETGAELPPSSGSPIKLPLPVLATFLYIPRPRPRSSVSLTPGSSSCPQRPSTSARVWLRSRSDDVTRLSSRGALSASLCSLCSLTASKPPSTPPHWRSHPSNRVFGGQLASFHRSKSRSRPIAPLLASVLTVLVRAFGGELVLSTASQRRPSVHPWPLQPVRRSFPSVPAPVPLANGKSSLLLTRRVRLSRRSSAHRVALLCLSACLPHACARWNTPPHSAATATCHHAYSSPSYIRVFSADSNRSFPPHQRHP